MSNDHSLLHVLAFAASRHQPLGEDQLPNPPNSPKTTSEPSVDLDDPAVRPPQNDCPQIDLEALIASCFGPSSSDLEQGIKEILDHGDFTTDPTLLLQQYEQLPNDPRVAGWNPESAEEKQVADQAAGSDVQDGDQTAQEPTIPAPAPAIKLEPKSPAPSTEDVSLQPGVSSTPAVPAVPNFRPTARPRRTTAGIAGRAAVDYSAHIAATEQRPQASGKPKNFGNNKPSAQNSKRKATSGQVVKSKSKKAKPAAPIPPSPSPPTHRTASYREVLQRLLFLEPLVLLVRRYKYTTLRGEYEQFNLFGPPNPMAPHPLMVLLVKALNQVNAEPTYKYTMM